MSLLVYVRFRIFMYLYSGGNIILKHLWPFYWHGLTFIPAWISNHAPSKVWDEITYPFLNFNGTTVEV